MRPARTAATLPALLAAILLAAGLPAARAQELAMPAVDDSPSSQLLLEQAADQSRANPREAVRLLVQALDAGPGLVVRSPRDPDLFVSVGARVHAMLAADPALREAYRKEVGPDADAQLARGELDALVRRRLDTEAGLRAAMLLAERALARGHFSQALACLERTADHDLLAPPRRERHAALLAEVRARVAAPAASALTPGFFDRSLAAGRWGETWRIPFVGPGAALGDIAPRGLPAVHGDRVLMDDGRTLRAVDRLSGRLLWDAAVQDDAWTGLRAPAIDADSAVVLSWTPGAGARAASGGLSCLDPATGEVRWDLRIDRLSSDRSLEGALPVGAPVLYEGRALLSVRKASARFENVSMLASVDLEDPRRGSWVRVLATSGSLRTPGARGGEAPLLHGGVAYLATVTGAVAAVDPWDGAPRWIRRFPVPVRDRVSAEDAFAASTPAVVGGRVWAVTPDRSRVVAIDAADGSMVSELPLGGEAGFGGPLYVLGDEAAGLVVAVGDRLLGIRAAQPGAVAWSAAAAGDLGPRGRVSVARTADPAAPVLVVPEERRTRVVEMRDGTDALVLEGTGDANAVMAGPQLLAASGLSLASWMPVAEAERTVRARMAGSDAPEDAMALLSLARQVRSPELARDGADESLRRARSLDADDPRLRELLRLLLAIDALDLESAAPLERALDEAARLAGMPERAGLARAERALRRGRARDAARIAVETAFAAAPGVEVPYAGGSRSIDAAARAIALRARAADPAADAGIADAADAALSAAPAASRAVALRRAARLAAGTAAGDRALAACAAALAGTSPRVLAQLVEECRALGATPKDDVLRPLGEWRDGIERRARVPDVQGEFRRAVEFRGRLPRHVADAGQVRGGVLTILDGEVAFRAAPSYAIAWRAPAPGADPLVVGADGDIVLCDDGPQGTGALTCIAPDGSVRWIAPAPAAADPADDPRADLGGGVGAGIPCIALPTAPVVAVLGRDGSVRGHDRATGAVRWTRPAGESPPLAVARSPLVIVVVERVLLDDGEQQRVTALDPSDGTPIAAWMLAGASEPSWVRVVPGGLVVVANSAGIEARRLAGGDEEAPYWHIREFDAQESSAGWSLPGHVAFVDRARALVLADAWTGAPQPAADADADTTVTTVLGGDGWCAALSRDGAIFIDATGQVRGRSAPGSDRTFVDAAAAKDRLFVIDHAVAKDEAAEVRSSVLLRDLDPRAGGLERSAPLLLRSLVRRITEVASVDGGVAVSNGATIQMLEFSSPAEAGSR